MKLTLSHKDKSWLSFDLKDLFWLALVVGLWASIDYRTKYTDNVLKWNEQLQQKIDNQNNLVNMVLQEELTINNAIYTGSNFSSMPQFAKVSFLNHLQSILDEVTSHREILASEIERLKAQSK